MPNQSNIRDNVCIITEMINHILALPPNPWTLNAINKLCITRFLDFCISMIFIEEASLHFPWKVCEYLQKCLWIYDKHIPLASFACFMHSKVCSFMPSTAETTSTTMSVTLAPLPLIALNAACPGVSIKVIFLPEDRVTIEQQKEHYNSINSLHG